MGDGTSGQQGNRSGLREPAFDFVPAGRDAPETLAGFRHPAVDFRSSSSLMSLAVLVVSPLCSWRLTFPTSVKFTASQASGELSLITVRLLIASAQADVSPGQ